MRPKGLPAPLSKSTESLMTDTAAEVDPYSELSAPLPPTTDKPDKQDKPDKTYKPENKQPKVCICLPSFLNLRWFSLKWILNFHKSPSRNILL